MPNKGLLLIIVLLSLLISCELRADKEALSVVKNMTLEEKIGQMIIAGISDKKMNPATQYMIENYLPGGIILFGYNLGSRTELKGYIDAVQASAVQKYRIPLFISIDQEGGRVRRIVDGVTQFPGNMAIGVTGNESMAFDAARITGIELRSLGINMNMAPDIDVNNNPSNPVINTRSFGSDTAIVSAMGSAYIKGLQKSGCIAVGKHFPGHGDTDKDSHLTLPVINYNLERLHKIEFAPFVKAIDSGLDAVMTAHISFPNIIKDNSPATISEKFLTDILRKEMHFNGIIMTDDVAMNAISKVMDMGEAAVKAVQAGADIVLVSSHDKSIDIISKSLKTAVSEGRITEKRIDESVKKIIEEKLKYRIMALDKDRIIFPEYNSGTDNMEILKKREELNRTLSRESLYLYPGSYPLENIGGKGSIFISNNKVLQKELGGFYKNKSDYRLFIKTSDFFSRVDSKKPAASVYYHFDHPNAAVINSMMKMCGKSGTKLYLICTGNPFPLKDIENLPPSLISFSNTDESIKQIAACLKGEFKPRQSINVDLGIKSVK